MVPALTVSSNHTYSVSAIDRYGPVAIYSENSVAIYAFGEELFNYTYRNVYVYIKSNYIIEGEDKIQNYTIWSIGICRQTSMN